MSHLNFDYVPLTFINDQEEIKKQIRNTLILIHLFEKYNNPNRLEKLIEGTQYGYNASALQSGKNKFLRISDIHESKVNWETVPYCNCDDEKTYLLKKDDILIARTGGTTGKSFKIDNPPAHSIYAGYLIRIRAKQEVNPDYIYMFLQSFAYWSQIVNLNERNFRPKANAENLKSLILPDCPANVQNDAVKISNGELVKGYEELYSAIEKALSEYDKTQEVQNLLTNQLTQLENLNQAILQEAVQGKLVPQDPKDEPSSELLKRIKAEKAKSGKKEKPLPPIKPEEIPFEIPENWVWCRFGEIIEYTENLDIQKHLSPDTIVNYVDIDAIDNQNFVIREAKQKTVSELSTRARRILKPDYIVYSTVRPYLKNIAIVEDEKQNYIGSTGFNVFRTLNVELKYAFYYLLAPFVNNSFKDLMVGFNSPSITNDQFEKSLFPLPPLSEQKRIVAEIEKQLGLTKQLKEHILANQQATEQLLKALLHQAFEVKEMETA
jgi:type I restriction enzyme S subunit